MNHSDQYNVVLEPQIRIGYEPEIVIHSFARLFKISSEKAEAVVGTRRVLKKALESSKAKQYQQKLHSIGLQVTLEKVDAAPQKVETPAQVKPEQLAPAGLSLVPTDEEVAAAAQQTPDAEASKDSVSGVSIVCPKCGLEQPRADECAGCGIYFHKLAESASSPTVQAETREPVQSEAIVEANEVTGETDSASLKMYLAPAGAALAGALIWKFIALATGFELGLIAWGIGGAIGFAAVMVGARGQQVAMVCAVLALLAIMGGKYMAMSAILDETVAAITGSDAYAGIDLQGLYEEYRADAAVFGETVNDDASLRIFMVDRGYSEAVNADAVSDEEVSWFREHEQPRLEEILYSEPQNFEAWKTESLTAQIENISTFDVMMESLGFLDILFLFLGIGTAYRMGMGES